MNLEMKNDACKAMIVKLKVVRTKNLVSFYCLPPPVKIKLNLPCQRPLKVHGDPPYILFLSPMSSWRLTMIGLATSLFAWLPNVKCVLVVSAGIRTRRIGYQLPTSRPTPSAVLVWQQLRLLPPGRILLALIHSSGEHWSCTSPTSTPILMYG
jgi:hypothetical protein